MQEIRNPVKAIRAKCIECCNGSSHEVSLCPCGDCALYPFRFGKNPYRTKREFTDAQKEEMRERMRKARESKKTNVIY